MSRSRIALAGAACALALFAGCRTAEPEIELEARVVEEAPWREETSEHGSFVVRWRPDPAPIPVNEPFELDVELRDAAGAPLPGMELFVHAWMPDHRHGMLREPRATDLDNGRYRVRGMLLHMGGRWQLFFDVVRGGELERAQLELELE